MDHTPYADHSDFEDLYSWQVASLKPEMTWERLVPNLSDWEHHVHDILQ